MSNNINIKEILIWILFFQIIGYCLGQITQSNLSWYNTLDKSSLNPSGIVFSIVWPILYIMIAFSGWFLWRNRKQRTANIALFFYVIQVLLNWAWTPLFFHFHLIGLSFFWIILIAFFTFITIFITIAKFKFSSLMLIPYFFWLIFAAYLNLEIWSLNSYIEG